MSRISIIIPVHNVENYIDICLDSVLAQSFTDFEVLCVNDGSTDTSLNILEKYADFDKRIRILTKQKGGVSDARNFGMKHITGEYTVFVDSDDWLSHLMLERMYKNIIEYKSDFNFCGVRRIDNITRDAAIWLLCTPQEFDNYVNNAPVFNESTIAPEFLYKTHTMAWGKLYRSEFIKDLKFPEGNIYEDNLFFVECYLRAKRISYDKSPLYYYRVNRESSIMKTKSENFRAIFDIADIVKVVYEKYSKFSKYKTEYLLHYLKAFFLYTCDIKDDDSRRESFNLLQERLKKIVLKEYNIKRLQEDKVFRFIYSFANADYQHYVEMLEQRKRVLNGKK